MNREIKFRAWDKATNTMYHNVFYKTHAVVILDMVDSKGNSIWIPKTNMDDSVRTEVMQYTGVKDKNGKEIYEGDIVKMISPTFEENGRLMVIEYDKNKLSYNFTPNFFLDLEVIGNIFENPELINE